ncbi:non-ribosomal peptide synthetase [Pedobacter antarcticus]|uniref:non-ribosomal peptide synthetase n=1 Tax=Pedobacter antarcticus TaxID=34086 RepID=UPI002930B032|nr:non-ribosomal peptide synthetase [Pedobacter antarcticus]
MSDYPPLFNTILNSLEDSALNHSNKTAIISENDKINFKDLDHKANKTARLIKLKGKYLNKPVAFCMEQSIERIIVMLAIWKAEAAYLSLDLHYPEERLMLMLEDMDNPLLITTKACAEKFNFYNGDIIFIDDTETQNTLKNLSTEKPPIEDLYDSTAYFAYTSGSTGIPKAVKIAHHAIANFVKHYGHQLEAEEADYALQISSPNFDGIALDLWAPLTLGITVQLYPDNRIIGDALLDFICEKGITIIPYIPFSTLATLPADGRKGNLRKVYTGGEVPASYVVNYWKSMLTLVNMYGPTETTVVVSVFTFDDVHPLTTIGKPFPNVTYYVLDEQLNPVPQGETGELFIGGIQVGNGYHNRAELTQARFIDLKNQSGDIEKVYKSGDIVRKLPDNNYEFVGRVDFQVKIRGYRVELSEIEEQLRQSPDIMNCSVLVRGEQPENKKLICYFISPSDVTGEKLRDYLNNLLPSYLVPSRFIRVGNFPLTANGKLDRELLATYYTEDYEFRDSYKAPQTPLQAELVKLWGAILEMEKIGINDNFFYFGGNSIYAYKLVSRIRTQLNLPLQIADLFLFPTISELTAYLAQKDKQWQENIEITRTAATKKVRLSTQQRSLWFIDRLNGSLPYHIGVIYPVEESISFSALQTAFRMLLDRHSVLRTVITEEEDEPYQNLISPENWQLHSLEDPTSLQFYLDIPFELNKDYMLRAYLINKVNKPSSLFLIIHHIATDGWSMPLLIRELNDLYQHIAHQKKPIPKEQPLQYRDYAYWQQTNITPVRINAGLDFWKNYLLEVPYLQLPLDYPRPSTPQLSGKQHQVFIPADLTEGVRTLSEEQHATLYMTLLSAFSLLMQYYSGQDDLCIGSPAANRTPSTADETIGYFVNMLPLRIQIEGNPVYEDLLQKIRQMLPHVFQNQEIPLELIIREQMKDRFNGHNSLFQTIFILQESDHTTDNASPVINHQLEWIFNGKSKFDLQFEVIPRQKGLLLNIEYADGLFKKETIANMATQYLALLESIIRNPKQKIGDLKFLRTLSHQQITSAPYQEEKTLVGLFEDQVSSNPSRIALTFKGESLSYLQLHKQSAIVANYLIRSGVKRGQFVACLMEQSLELVSGLLGVVKSGAAYIPMDINNPIERMNVLIDDTNPSFLVTTYNFKKIAEMLQIPVLYLEDILNTGTGEQEMRSFTNTHSPSDLIYVIHTSGTTGIPKGVLIEHRAISNFTTRYGDLLDIGSEDRTLQFSPYNFDGSVMDIWIPLIKGATVHLYPNNKLLGENLANFLQLHAITVIPFISPSVLSTLPESAAFPHLRVIATGAEVCPLSLSRCWISKVKLLNAYGPTETTVAVNNFVFDTRHSGNTLGKPIQHIRFYILDKYRRQVPEGAIGELYISGIQVARGYLNQPELTAEKFPSNPFIQKDDPNEFIYNRMYKTGDRVRLLKDGMIEYAGREDQQIKIRGYRVELSEIEAALQQIDGIGQAVVQLVRPDSDLLSIRAYITGDNKKSSIRAELDKKLPAYMIPAEIIRIEELPVKHNGKLDLHALARFAEESSHETEEEQQELNEHEQLLKEIWSDVLKLKSIQVDDNFFHLGGHSLLLTKLYSRIAQHYPGKISLSELYINNTIRKLARLIETSDTNLSPENYSLGNDPLSEELKIDAAQVIDPDAFNYSSKGNFTNPRAILLTGATGFVGIHMLAEFIRTTQASIYLLIRSDNEKHAAERLLKTIRQQLLPVEIYDSERVKLLTGDLSKPLLGLSETAYGELAKKIDVIYHAGGAVNFIQPYAYMKAANIGGLRSLIQLATTVQLKQISLLSTVGVYSWEHYFTHPEMIMENDPTDPAFKYLSRDMGYIQSKWVMEKIADKAIKLGVPVIIFRLGYAFCHSLNGATAKYQWWSSLVKTCIELNSYPMLAAQKEELIAVDFIGKAIAHISKNPNAPGKIFHLSSTKTDNISVTDFFVLLNKEFGMNLKPLPYTEWMSLWENDEQSPLYPLLSLFKFKVYDDKSIIEIHQNTPDFDTSNTLHFLKDSDIRVPAIDRNMLSAYLKNLGIEGF